MTAEINNSLIMNEMYISVQLYIMHKNPFKWKLQWQN